jgi:hypothetical protein
VTKRIDPAEQDSRQREAMDTDPYAIAVVNILSGDFPDLRDPVTAEIVREHVSANVRRQCLIEVIVDDPYFANWRLVPAPHDRRRVHLGCWRLNRTEADTERWNRLNAALDALEIQ